MSYKRNNYKTLAEKFYSEGNLQRSLELYKRALEFEGSEQEDCLLLFNLGAISLELGDLEKAEIYNMRILEIDKDWRDALYQMGIIKEEQGNLDSALEFYEMISDSEPLDVDSRYNMALIYEELGNIKEMNRIYEEILRIDPSHFYTLNNLGAASEATGNYEEAKKYLLRSIESNPDFYLSHFNLGVVWKAIGDNISALDQYYISKQLKPDFGNTYLNISAILIDQDRLVEAVDILSEGIKNIHDPQDLYYNRACCNAKLGRDLKAVEDIGTALSLNPYLVVWANRDKDFDKLRKQPEFIKHIDRALEAIQKGR